MAHAWKACWVQALGGSNPPSSATTFPRNRNGSGDPCFQRSTSAITPPQATTHDCGRHPDYPGHTGHFPSGMPMNHPTSSLRSRALSLLPLLLFAPLAAGCAADSPLPVTATTAASPRDTASTSAPSSTPSETASAAPLTKDQPLASAAPATNPNLPAGAYAGAGGPLPAKATPLVPNASGVASFKTPSGNIGCDISATSAGCGVMSYITDETYGTAPMTGDSKWWVSLDAQEIGLKGDAPWFDYPGTPTATYGALVYFGTTVCASEEAGLTCWNTTTHHGAFINRDATTFF